MVLTIISFGDTSTFGGVTPTDWWIIRRKSPRIYRSGGNRLLATEALLARFADPFCLVEVQVALDASRLIWNNATSEMRRVQRKEPGRSGVGDPADHRRAVVSTEIIDIMKRHMAEIRSVTVSSDRRQTKGSCMTNFPSLRLLQKSETINPPEASSYERAKSAASSAAIPAAVRAKGLVYLPNDC